MLKNGDILTHEAKDSREMKVNQYLVVTCSLAALSTFNVGYNIGVGNIVEHKIRICDQQIYDSQGFPDCLPAEELLWGVIISLLALGGLCGAILASKLLVWLGRRNAILFNNIFYIVGGILIGTSTTLGQFGVGRFICGMGCGVSLVTVSTYIGEVATHKTHGALGGIFQIMLVTGVFLSHGFSIPLNYAPGWRVLFAITGIPSLIQLGLFPFCVETPAYLISQGKLDQAKENLIKLRDGYDTTQEFQDLVDRQNKLNGGQKVNPYKAILNNKKLLKHMLICIMVHIAQQWCGINGILFYSATIFSLAFGKENAAYLALGTDAVFILFTLVFIFIADRLSRKWLMIITLISTAICSILVTVGLKLTIDVMVAVFIFIFIAIFALGIGPIPWMIVSELFPSDQLPAASGVAMATNWLFNFIFTLVFPSILKQVEAFTFLIFAVIAIVFAAGVLFFVPETKGKTIDQLLEG